jgi:hypothetical protein
VLFDKRTTVGMVRLRVKQTVLELTQLFEAMFRRTASPDRGRPAPEAAGPLDGADDEIDRLFED